MSASINYEKEQDDYHRNKKTYRPPEGYQVYHKNGDDEYYYRAIVTSRDAVWKANNSKNDTNELCYQIKYTDDIGGDEEDATIEEIMDAPTWQVVDADKDLPIGHTFQKKKVHAQYGTSSKFKIISPPFVVTKNKHMNNDDVLLTRVEGKVVCTVQDVTKGCQGVYFDLTKKEICSEKEQELYINVTKEDIEKQKVESSKNKRKKVGGTKKKGANSRKRKRLT